MAAARGNRVDRSAARGESSRAQRRDPGDRRATPLAGAHRRGDARHGRTSELATTGRVHAEGAVDLLTELDAQIGPAAAHSARPLVTAGSE